MAANLPVSTKYSSVNISFAQYFFNIKELNLCAGPVID